MNLMRQGKLFSIMVNISLYCFNLIEYTGDWGDKFYVIIRGAVYILLKENNAVAKEPETKKQEQQQFQRRAQREKTRVLTLSRIESLKLNEGEEGSKNEIETGETKILDFRDDLDDEEKLKIIKHDYPGFFLGRVMETGSAFGEIALQNKTLRYS